VKEEGSSATDSLHGCNGCNGCKEGEGRRKKEEGRRKKEEIKFQNFFAISNLKSQIV
jgi:hypothetical protein